MESAGRSKRSGGFILLFTLLIIAAYGLLIPKLSFYGDDWIYIYNYHIVGASGFTRFVAWDRPYSNWVYILASALFGENVLPYHLLLLVQRWLAVFLFFRILKTVWGERRSVYAAVLLFALYPGFQQQPISVQYIMHFSSLDLGLLSILLMLRAVKAKGSGRVLRTIGAAAASLLGLFTCEYFIGLEFLRPVLLYCSLRDEESRKERFRKTFLNWLPYLGILILYLVWRVFIFSFQTYGPKFLDELAAAPAAAIRDLVRKIAADTATIIYKVYRYAFRIPEHADKIVWAAILLIGAVSAYLVIRASGLSEAHHGPEKEMLTAGIVLFFASGIPYWVTKLDITVSYPWDRSTLSFSPAIGLILGALIPLIFRPVPGNLVLAVLAAVCAAFHYGNGCIYRYEADKMNDYFWQLAWRAPALEKGTIIASDDIPLNRYSDNDLAPIVNWQYAPRNFGLKYDYKYFDLDLRTEAYYQDPGVSVPVDHTYRTHRFVSSTEKTLAVYYREGGCLQIIDESKRDYPNLPDSVRRISGMSDISLIKTGDEEETVPPKAIGPEPQHGFCYYAQQAELAAQYGDSEAAETAAETCLSLGLTPKYGSDWAPIFRVLAEKGETERLSGLLRNVEDTEMRKYLCRYLSSVNEQTESLCDSINE